MQIFVKTLAGKIITLDVEPTHTIEDIVNQLGIKGDISVDSYRLLFAGQQLQEARTIQDYNIEKESTLYLVFRLRAGYQIFIKTATGKVINLEVDSEDSIQTLKTKLYNKEGSPLDNQTLLFRGQQLRDEMRLADYNIQKDATLHLVIVPIQTQIFIKTLKGNTITLNVNTFDTIQQVKVQIQDKEGILVEQQRLANLGRMLEDERTLDYYNIKREATLHLMLVFKGGMQIFIKTLSGKALSLQADPSDNIHSVKNQIQEKEGIPIDQQRLVFTGLELQDAKELVEYGVTSESTFFLILRLRGGQQK